MSTAPDIPQFAMNPKVGQRVSPAHLPDGNHTGRAGRTRLPKFTLDMRAGGTRCPPLAPIQLRAFTLIELLVVIAIMGVLASLMLPAFSRAKARSRNSVCVSQLRQLGIATRVYTDENNNLLPAAELLPTMPLDPARPLLRICDVLGSYAGRASPVTNAGPTVFKCPGDMMGRFASEGSSYQWDTQLNGHRMDETSSQNLKFVVVWVGDEGSGQTNGTVQLKFPPATTPLLLDYEDFHPRPPKPGKNVVFMDNHVAPLEVPPLN